MAVLSEKDFLPKWIAWESTRVCNLSCVHCRCSSDLDAERGVFTTKAAFMMIDDISEIYKPVFVISGGEPLMREDVFDIAAYSTGKGFRTCMATNGILITDETCDRMKESGIRMVSLSLDGSTA
ncbi:MAG: radical SAM protein, partial [Deltaproteobacteria bacterium]|nr:radical SAM protein [Deltaproteobacteria bacterium]